MWGDLVFMSVVNVGLVDCCVGSGYYDGICLVCDGLCARGLLFTDLVC